jgi:hypothetical protein
VELGCGACGRGSHPRTREVGGNRPCPLRGAALNGWTRTGGRRAKSRWSGPGGHKPGPEVRSLEQKSRDGAPKGGASRMSAVAGGLRSATCYPVAPFGASSPSFFEGANWKAHFARRRGTDGAWAQITPDIWLFDNCIRELTRRCPGRGAALWCRSADPGPTAIQIHGPRICDAILRIASHPGHEAAMYARLPCSAGFAHVIVSIPLTSA